MSPSYNNKMIISGVPKKYVLDTKKIVDLMEKKKRDGELLSEFDECALCLAHDLEMPEGLDLAEFIRYLYDNGFSIEKGSFEIDGTRIEYNVLFLSRAHQRVMWDNIGGWWRAVGRVCDAILAQLETPYPLKQTSE